MSFISGLQSAGGALGKVTNAITPFLGLIGLIPGLQGETGTIIGRVLQVVFLAETVITSAGSGQLKKDSVMPLLRAALPGFSEQRLSQIVDAAVSLLNLISNGQTSGGLTQEDIRLNTPVTSFPVTT